MADTITIPATGSGTATPVVATDDCAAAGHAQIIKLAISTDGSATLIPADGTAGLKVDLGADNDVTVTSGSITATQGTATNLKAQAEAYQGGSAVGAANPLQVTLANGSVPSHAVTNAGTFVVQENGAALTALQLIDDVVYTDDTSTHTTGASKGALVMAVAAPTDGSVDANDIGAMAMTTDRKLLVSVPDSVTVAQATATNLKTQAEAYQGGSAVAAGNPLQVSLANTAANATAVKVDGSAVTQPVSYATTGSGTATGALRVELANNGTGLVGLNAGTNAIGKLAANSGVDIGDVDVLSIAAGTNKIGDVDIAPRTTGGWSVGNFNTGDTYTALTNSAQVVKGSAGKFGGYYIYNPNTAATYVLVYNVAAASVVVGTTTARLVFCIPAQSAANLELLAGVPFDTAIAIAAATTGGGNTAPSTALEAMVFYV